MKKVSRGYCHLREKCAAVGEGIGKVKKEAAVANILKPLSVIYIVDWMC